MIDGGFYLESVINGDILNDVWKEVLYHYSSKDNHFSHYVCLSYAKW